MPGISSRGGSSNASAACDSGCSAMAETYTDRPSLVTTMLRRMSHLDTVRQMLACFSAGDPQGQLDHCADDVVYEAPYYSIERHGKAALAAMLASVQERFDEVSYVVVDDFPTIDPDLVFF